MPRLTALLAIVLLLLPSSLGAAVHVAKDCSTLAEQVASCCCEHLEPQKNLGPFLDAGCCCEVDVPLEPLQRQEIPRVNSTSEVPTPPAATATGISLPTAGNVDSGIVLVPRGPSRAPPGSILVRFQRFLI